MESWLEKAALDPDQPTMIYVFVLDRSIEALGERISWIWGKIKGASGAS